MNYFLKY